MGTSDNMLSYLDWRGDLSMKANPFNEIDAMLFTELVYCKFEQVIPKEGITIENAARLYKERVIPNKAKMDYTSSELVLFAMASCSRFKKMRLLGYVSETRMDIYKQFAVMQIQLQPFLRFVAFRGTDGSFAGWKENFHMCYMNPVPSQQAAKDYVNEMCNAPFTKYIFGGHSKGGNLAMYAGAFCNAKIQKKLKKVYAFDSPGFNDSLICAPEMETLRLKLESFAPQDSVVGMLLNPVVPCKIIHSQSKGLQEHFLLSWSVENNALYDKCKRSSLSIQIETTLKGWISQLTDEQKKMAVNAFFDVLYNAGIHTMEEFTNINVKNLVPLMKATKGLTPEMKENIFKVMSLLLKKSE